MFPQSIQDLINQLSKLPEIGPRAATRLVFFLINQDQYELDKLSSLIKEAKTQIKLCPQCFNLSANNSQELCSICQDTKRDQSSVCLVENILNILPIERTKQYNGFYHILGGLISPTNKIGPDNLRIKELLERIKSQPAIKEVIFALNPTTEGDTTVLYIERLLQPLKIKTTRLARGLSVGCDLTYTDENTLTSALLGRR